MQLAHKLATRCNVTLVFLLANVFILGISTAGFLPWMALTLEAQGASPITIGIVSAVNSVGIMAMLPFAGRIIQRINLAKAMIFGNVVITTTIALMLVFDDTVSWTVLRFVNGLGSAIPWVASEAWVNALASERYRGRIVSLYGVMIACGIASGPVVLTLFGVEGNAAAIAFIALSLASATPIIFIRHRSPAVRPEPFPQIWTFAAKVPTVIAAAFVAGAVDTTLFAFLPIWCMHMNLEPAMALGMLSVFVAGNIVMQFPIGWLADVTNTRLVMEICAGLCLVSPLAASVLVTSPILLGALLFIWGGAAWGLYSLALIDLGHRFTGIFLVAANGAVVMSYTFANSVVPPFAGLMIASWGPNGLMGVATLIAVMFSLALISRRLTKQHTDKQCGGDSK